jgi:hypothetical protein
MNALRMVRLENKEATERTKACAIVTAKMDNDIILVFLSEADPVFIFARRYMNEE